MELDIILQLVVGSLLTGAVAWNWHTGRARINELELKVAELMKRDEVIEHVEKQITGVKELLNAKLDPMKDDLKYIREHTK